MGILDELLGLNTDTAQASAPSFIDDILALLGGNNASQPTETRAPVPSLSLLPFGGGGGGDVTYKRMTPVTIDQASTSVMPTGNNVTYKRMQPVTINETPSASTEPTAGERFAAFARGQSGNGDLLTGLAAAFGGVDREKAMLNRNIAAMQSKGLSPYAANLVANDPQLMRQILPKLFSRELGDAPHVQEMTDEYGRKSLYTWNSQTRQYEPIKIAGQPEAQATQATQASEPPSLVPQTATQQAMPAGAVSTQPTAVQPAPLVFGQQQFARETKQDMVTPETIGAIRTAQNLGAQTATGGQPGQTKSLGIEPGQFVGPALPKVPEGFMQRSAPGGAGFLYTKDASGRAVPILDNKAAVEARGRTQEQLDVKRGVTLQQAEENVGGLKEVVKGARQLSETPGFENGLKLHRMSLDLGVQAGQFGFIGGDVMSPAKQITKMFDPKNPAWSAADAITQVQSELSLTAGRVFLKEQGNVSNFERQMVADAIGNISGATSKADYQFRLNAAEKMIEDVNAGIKLKSGGNYNSRPTEAELMSVLDNKRGTYSEDKLIALADKYHVHGYDMLQYVQDWYKRGS